MTKGSPDDRPEPSGELAALLALMARLRDPVTGCPWDVEQSFTTIAPYTVEEAYEVADAAARGDLDDLRDELGDLLLQVVFHARMAEEIGAFAFADVVEAISAKLIRRHPHVFGDARDLTPAAVKALWDEIKRTEKAERAARRGEPSGRTSALDGVPAAWPALLRADKLARKAAAVGFTWTEAAAVIGKMDEELNELRAALASGSQVEIAGEIGDVLFTAVNLARLAGVDPETALAATNRKFERRFRSVEAALADAGRVPGQASLDEMDELWTQAKASEQA